MRLSSLLQDIATVSPEMDCSISSITLDSREVRSGSLFFALKGKATDGRQYLSDAIKRGARALLVEADSLATQAIRLEGVPCLSVQQLRDHVGIIAGRFYREPAKKLRMIGVTGTNGKTSCTHFIAQVLRERCGIIGTLGSGIYGALKETGMTTPDAVTLQATLAQLVDEGVKVVAMEVSSHSIDQGRVNGIEYEMGMFTNLTQDHLDYHGSMESYAAVKRRFFADMPTQHLIINADDPYGQQWIHEFAHHKSLFAYSTEKPSTFPDTVPLIYTENVTLTLQGIKATVHSPWGNGILLVPLVGRFNLSNVLAVLTAACFYGIPFNEVLERLSQLTPIPGRMQASSGPGLPLVVVDYAHTPDALKKVLQALKPHIQGKLYCVFGCGGDRDAGKRPLMANIAEALSDQIIVTNDNPRHEDPEAIAEQICQGFQHRDRVSVILDRSKAIENSIQCAEVNDCVLIAGKGAEHYQQIKDRKTHFDDMEEVNRYLAEKLNVTVVK